MGVTALVIGDLHLSGQNISETQLAASDIVRISRDHNTDFVVFLGDVLDKFQNVHISALRVMCDMFNELHTMGRTVHVITGNHDRPNNQHYLTNEHPFHGIMNIATVAATSVTETVIKGHKFLFVPYVPDGRFLEAIKDSDKSIDNTTCIFAHQTFMGAHLGSCISETGDEWSSDKPLVISGHIHGYCVLQPNLVYAGACMQHGYSDSADRAILLCSWGGTGGEDNHWVELEGVRYKRLPLPSIPRKLRIDMTCDELKLYKPVKNTLVQIRLSGTCAEIQTVLKLSKVRNFPDTVKITVNRQVEHDAFLETSIPKFGKLLHNAIIDSHPHLMEYHKRIERLVKDA